jgi:hypothetical protein
MLFAYALIIIAIVFGFLGYLNMAEVFLWVMLGFELVLEWYALNVIDSEIEEILRLISEIKKDMRKQ